MQERKVTREEGGRRIWKESGALGIGERPRKMDAKTWLRSGDVR
jgi:hypothetical protein